MIRKSVFLCLAICVTAIASACVSEPIVMGEAVRSVMQSQINDYETTIHPNPNAGDDGDPYRLDAALNIYRTDVAESRGAQEPLPIDFGN